MKSGFLLQKKIQLIPFIWTSIGMQCLLKNDTPYWDSFERLDL